MMAPTIKSRNSRTRTRKQQPRRSSGDEQRMKKLSVGKTCSTGEVDKDLSFNNSSITSVDFDHHDDNVPSSSSPCSTPKAKRFQIPEITTCPPAPKKRRLLPSCTSLLQRHPIAFFAPPDLELFFYFAMNNISA